MPTVEAHCREKKKEIMSVGIYRGDLSIMNT